MTFNFDNLKIPVFANINDKPTAPTASKAGNGSHLINSFNSLLDEIATALNAISTNQPTYSNRYKVVTDRDGYTEYTASVNEQIVINTGASNFKVTLPSTNNLNQGDFVTIVNCTEGMTIQIENYGYLDGANNITQLTFNRKGKPVTFVWQGDYYKWFSIDSFGILNKQYQAD